jgi:cell fate (sporulation/competence/biofilm development) regulator YlbF (YheA/YmcA/DUF963 family)
MIETLNEQQQVNYDNFFSNADNLHLSPSALKLLKTSPKAYFKHYVLDEKEIKVAKYFDEGSLVHCMVLEPEELNNKFVNMGIAVPTDSTRLCLENLLALERTAEELEEYTAEIIEYLKEINLHQSLVDDKKADKNGQMLTGDEKRLAKIITENSKEYFRIMMEGKSKIIVDSATWDKCYAKAQAILNNSDAKNLLYKFNDDDEIRFELELSDRPDELQYGIKGILDAIKVNRKEKVIYISDIKTHSGKLKDFPDSVNKYGHWMQPVAYKILAQSLLRKKAFDYKIIFHFIVVDQNDDVYCFPVKEESMESWSKQLVEMINVELSYHINNKDFTLPYEFANKLISL